MQRRWWVFGVVASCTGLLGALACGAGNADDFEGSNRPGAGGGSYADAGYNGYPSGSSGGAMSDAASDPALPPEQELESSYESPVATGRFVWVTNPASGRVAYVDATSLEVRTVLAGNGPRYLAAVPSSDADVAVVVNTLSSDATILRAGPGGTIETKTLRIATGANSWAMSHDGRWAIAWTDARLETGASPLQGFQDVTAVDLTPGQERAIRLSVGYRPVALSFSANDAAAYAVTQDGVSVLEFDGPGGPRATRVVPLTDDPLEDPDTRDVSITPDGSWALVRRDGHAQVTVVSLSTGALTTVPLPAPCTDLDLSPDGRLALAALRDLNDIALLPVPAIATSPDVYELLHVDKATVGSIAIAPAASIALAYSNAVQEERITSVGFDTTPAQITTMRLHGAVQSVFPSHTGASAIVVHQPIPGSPGAFSTLSLAPLLPARIQSTKAPITAVALTPSGDRAVVAERSDLPQVYGAYLVRGGNQQVDRYELTSPPAAVGAVVGANRAYVAQEHPEGRLTFIDLDTGLARTLTGFELGARVIDGSQP